MLTADLTAQTEPTPPAPPQDAPAQGKHETTELGKWMDHMNSAFRNLRRQVALTEQNAASRELVAEMITGAEKARALQPEKLAEIPEADREKFLSGYHEQMDKLLTALRQLDAALAAGDNPAAEGLVRELRGVQRDGHKVYKVDRD
ncbi:MAG: hypothetical protein IT582_07915 [Opitutaceae bacterium]|nr:hypothetical protein [Opitutaceae bacterium]